MAKFFRLVHNEYVKTFKRISTRIMFVLVILTGIGISVMTAVSRWEYERWNGDYYGSYDPDSYRSEIEWYNQTKEPGYEKYVMLNEYLLEYGENASAEQRQLAYSVTESVSEEDLPKYLDNIFKDNDWRAVCTALMESMPEGAARWEYKYRLDNDIPFGNTWKDNMIAQAAAAKIYMEVDEANGSQDSVSMEEYQKQAAVAMYRLDNNIEYVSAGTGFEELLYSDSYDFWTAFNLSAAIVPLIGLLIIVIAGNSVASEFSQGTIKFLLINPVKRWKILMSKYFTVISVGYIMLALLYLVMIPSAGISMGFDAIGASYIYFKDGAVHEMSAFLYAARAYLLNSLSIVIMATLAFAVSSLLKSAAFSIGISVFLMLAGNTIVNVLQQLNQDWARYLIFANTNLTDIAAGSSMFAHQTLGFAIGVLIAHMAVFILTAWDGFVKREV